MYTDTDNNNNINLNIRKKRKEDSFLIFDERKTIKTDNGKIHRKKT